MFASFPTKQDDDSVMFNTLNSQQQPPQNNAKPVPSQQNLVKQGFIQIGTPVTLNSINPYEKAVLERFQQCVWEAEEQAKNTIALAQEKADALEETARNRALELIEKAHQKAADIEDTALAKQAQIETDAQEQGFQAGFEAGLASGYETAGEETLDLLNSAKQIQALAYQTQHRILKELKQEALVLMEHVLKQTGYEAWQTAPTKFMANKWDTALEALKLTGKVTVVLHPHHLELLQNFHPSIEACLADCSRFQFQTDSQLPLDACYLISSEGCFDVSFSAQVSSAMNHLAHEGSTPRCFIDTQSSATEAVEKASAETPSP
jgi:flagellar biosynthesis/type III secretory pathway protein FliH